MSKLVLELSVSLDGYIAGPNDTPDNGLGDGGQALFAWYGNGDTPVALPGTDMVFNVSRVSAGMINEYWPRVGASVTGRRTFDIAHAWGGHPPGGGNHFVLTHHPPAEWVYDGSPFTFVTGGIESAVRQAKVAAAGKDVDVIGSSIAQQALNAGLLDELQLDLAPVLLGGGVRLFDHLNTGAVPLERLFVIEGQGVTHIRYRVVK